MRRRWTRAGWLLLLIPLAWGLGRVRLDTDILNLLPPAEPSVQGLKIYQRHFANARELIVTLRAGDADHSERLAEALANHLRRETNLVAAVSWQPPWMEDASQAAEIAGYLWFNQPPGVFGGLTNRLSGNRLSATLAESRRILATSFSPLDIARRSVDPFDLLAGPALESTGGMSAEQGERMFASADGALRILYVQARRDLSAYPANAAWLQAVQDLVDALRANQADWSGVTVRYTGRPAFVAEIAGSMRRDLSGSVLGTALIIAALFWLMHRRWLPMLWLLALLALVLAGTVALGGIFLGAISALSLGFAAVLLGLAVDYAVVHYQEALSHPQLTIRQVRRAIAPSILWAAITTISAFLVLNLGGLPGLAQLGTLVAMGVALAAIVMVMIYLPPLFPDRWKAAAAPNSELNPGPNPNPNPNPPSLLPLVLTLLLAAFAAVVLAFHFPPLDESADALKPKHSEAQAALEEMTAAIGLPRDPLLVIVSGDGEGQVFARLRKVEAILQQAVTNRVIGGFSLPTALWPRVENQQANRPAAGWLAGQGPRLRAAATAAGFKTNALFLTDELLRTWARAARSESTFWPTNPMSEWLLRRFIARSGHESLALGLVYPNSAPPPGAAASGASRAALVEVSGRLAREDVLLSSWALLGGAALESVRHRWWRVVTPMIALVLGSLWLAFRRLAEVAAGIGVLGLSSLLLLAAMSLAGWSWNLLNLMGVPLILGTGVDYSIFMQLALRRHGGDVRLVRRSIGRALLLCGGTAIAGFGSLGWSSNEGMAGLGRVCALGIAANMLIAVGLLPAWWTRLTPRARALPADAPTAPPRIYSAALWRLGLRLVRVLPGVVLDSLCMLAAEAFYLLDTGRRRVVVQNLLPVFGGDDRAARQAARRLFRQFAAKMEDLWRYEGGAAVDSWFNYLSDWTVFDKAQERRRGVVVVTAHLGNWEIGGPILAGHGAKLTAITQAEPGPGLTELRRQSRARWGIDTVVIGDDSFGFVEIIRRLQEGGTTALLIDRAPGARAVTVELFGRPFQASPAAAELARSTGCALVGVTIVRIGKKYHAKVLPEFQYDRRSLGSREGRQQLTQEILRALEPEIRRHPDQWFHFVPVWPAPPGKGPSPDGALGDGLRQR